LSPGEILYADLLGVILVFTADVFGLWDPWTRLANNVLERIKARFPYR
jgi:hypothetical protein